MPARIDTIVTVNTPNQLTVVHTGTIDGTPVARLTFELLPGAGPATKAVVEAAGLQTLHKHGFAPDGKGGGSKALAGHDAVHALFDELGTDLKEINHQMLAHHKAHDGHK
jgi:hypothetical protein